jgi:hypothetical protein
MRRLLHHGDRLTSFGDSLRASKVPCVLQGNPTFLNRAGFLDIKCVEKRPNDKVVRRFTLARLFGLFDFGLFCTQADIGT